MDATIIALTPLYIVIGIVLLAIVRLYDEFSKAAAAEIGKSFGKRLGEILARRAGNRFGVYGIAGIGIVAVGSVAALTLGMSMALASPDCETQRLGYTISAGVVGVWT